MTKAADAFRTISEVADWLGVQTHVLRFWESKFPQVVPVKRAGGRRYYRPEDMRLLGGIKVLLHDEGMTIKGAQKLIKDRGVGFVSAKSKDVDDMDLPDPVVTEEPAPTPRPVQKPATPAPKIATSPPALPNAKPPAPAPHAVQDSLALDLPDDVIDDEATADPVFSHIRDTPADKVSAQQLADPADAFDDPEDEDDDPVHAGADDDFDDAAFDADDDKADDSDDDDLDDLLDDDLDDDSSDEDLTHTGLEASDADDDDVPDTEGDDAPADIPLPAFSRSVHAAPVVKDEDEDAADDDAPPAFLSRRRMAQPDQPAPAEPAPPPRPDLSDMDLIDALRTLSPGQIAPIKLRSIYDQLCDLRDRMGPSA